MGLAEKMVGIKAKTFLMTVIYEFTKKQSAINARWAEIASDLIHKAVASSFKMKSDDKRIEDQTIKFLQWLGFSPVDLKWNAEIKIAQFFIGTSRIWREDPRNDAVAGVIMKALISALGVNLFEEKPQVELIEENLPPRTLYGFELTERYGDFSPLLQGEGSPISSPKSVTDSGKPVVSSKASTASILRIFKPFIDPIIGNSVDSDEAAKGLFESTKLVLETHYPEVIDFNINILLLLFQKSAKDDKYEEISQEVGKKFALILKENYPDISPNAAIKGLGALDPEKIDELLFSGKHPHQSIEYCQFISNIWNIYITEFMGREFIADKPLCAKTGSNLCLFAYTPQ